MLTSQKLNRLTNWHTVTYDAKTSTSDTIYKMKPSFKFESLIWCIIGEVEGIQIALKNNSRHRKNFNYQTESVGLPGKNIKKLRKRLHVCVAAFEAGENGTLDRVEIIAPFVSIVRGGEATGEVTIVVLQSLINLMNFGIFQLCGGETRSRARIADALSLLVKSVSRCRFNMTDLSFDETVLYNVVECLKLALTRPWGRYVDGESIWASVEVMFRMSQETRRSELLQSAAASSLISVIHFIFRNFVVLEAESTSTKKDIGVEVTGGRLPGLAVSNVETSGCTDDTSAGKVVSNSPYSLSLVCNFFQLLVDMLSPHCITKKIQKLLPGTADLIKIRKLGFRLIDNVLRICGDSISDCKPVMSIIEDDLCKYLTQTMLTTPAFLTDALHIFRLLILYFRADLKMQIEVVFNAIYLRALSGSIKNPTSVQIVLENLNDLSCLPAFWNELYVNYDCDPRCSNVMENLCKLLAKNTFPVFLRVDKQHVLGHTQLLSLKCLINGMKFIVERCEDPNTAERFTVDRSNIDKKEHINHPESDFSLRVQEILKTRRSRKIIVSQVVQSFNNKPKHIVKWLKNGGIILDEMSETTQATIISEFIRYTPLLNKASVGQYLASGDTSFDATVRAKYINLFDLRDKPMLTALRTFLGAFRLPGEAQQIDRLLQAFANETYMNSADAPLFATADVAYLLSFSIIMLNTDLHNPNIKQENKMSLSGFIKQNKNYGQEVSAGKDLPLEFLVGIYNSIKTNELRKFEDDDDGFLLGSVTNNMWGDFLSRDKQDLRVSLTDGGRAYLILNHLPGGAILESHFAAKYVDPDIFSIVWGPTVNALSVTFDTVHEGKLMDLALDGFILTCKVAAAYQMHSVFDSVVCTLLRFSKWADDDLLGLGEGTSFHDIHLANKPSFLFEGTHNAALNSFGKDHKAQMASIAAFGVVRKFGSSIRQGWSYILQCILQMGEIGLLPQTLVKSVPDEISTQRSQKHFESMYSNNLDPVVNSAKLDSSFFSWIFGAKNDTSRYKAPISGERTRALEDILDDNANTISGNTLVDEVQKAARCIKSCHLEDFLSDTKLLGDESFLILTTTLMLVTHRSLNLKQINRSTGIIKSADAASDSANIDSTQPHNFTHAPNSSGYFCIYWITEIVLHNRDRLHLVVEDVIDFLVKILIFEEEPNEIVDIAGRGLLRLAIRLSHKPNLINKLLHSLLVFTPADRLHNANTAKNHFKYVKPEISFALSGYLGTAIIAFVKLGASNITAPIAWRDMFSILRTCALYNISCRDGFAALSFLILDQQMKACVPLTVTSTVVTYATSVHGIEANSLEQKPLVSTFYRDDAVNLLYHLHKRVGPLIKRFTAKNDNAITNGNSSSVIEATSFDAWVDCWRPVLTAMAQCLENAGGKLCFHTVSLIQKSLLDSHGNNLPGQQWKLIFEQLLFPILAKELERRDLTLAKEHDANIVSDSLKVTVATYSNLKIAVINMVSKVYLSRLQLLSRIPDFHDVWAQFLVFLKKFIHYSRDTNSTELYESVLEIIKNIILVKQRMSLFAISGVPTELWQLTYTSIHLLCGDNFWLELNLSDILIKEVSK